MLLNVWLDFKVLIADSSGGRATEPLTSESGLGGEVGEQIKERETGGVGSRSTSCLLFGRFSVPPLRD